ncbi:hypothetical protein [Aestuariivirga sp.]
MLGQARDRLGIIERRISNGHAAVIRIGLAEVFQRITTSSPRLQSVA